MRCPDAKSLTWAPPLVTRFGIIACYDDSFILFKIDVLIPGTYTIEALNYAAEEDLGDDETVPNFTVFIGDGDATDSEETGLFDENLDIAAEGLRSKSKAVRNYHCKF